MEARPAIRSGPLRTGKLGIYFRPGNRSGSFDLAAIAMTMCLLLAIVGCEKREATARRHPLRSKLLA